jgi:hypothetical protein
MWPFKSRRQAVVVFHVDQDGIARGAFFRGDADVLIIDERDPKNRVYRMAAETSVEDLRRKIGRHPLGRLLDEPRDKTRNEAPVLNLHWAADSARAS